MWDCEFPGDPDQDPFSKEALDSSLSNLPRLNLGFGETPFEYSIENSEGERDKIAGLLVNNIGNWLGYDSLVADKKPAKKKDDFLSGAPLSEIKEEEED